MTPNAINAASASGTQARQPHAPGRINTRTPSVIPWLETFCRYELRKSASPR
ncbi:MAG: hypothetical protein M5U05_14410 [Anaerolineales bacterium]|nr:hypothetical protein [Anaerolineales bacterium]